MKIIVTMYSLDAFKLLDAVDNIVLKTGSVKILGSDSARLYNDENHEDVSMAAVTFSTDESLTDIKEYISDDDVFVCEEDPTDW